MALTDATIRNTKPAANPVRLTDGGGLYVEVRPNGEKLWRLRYSIAGKENILALGEYPAVSLSDARNERAKASELIKQGIHPAHSRQTMQAGQVAENANTFEAVAREWIDQWRATWSGDYLRQVERFLARDVYPYIGTLPIRSVKAAHLLEIMQRVEERGAPDVAVVLAQWSSEIFRYAVSTLRADVDPAAALKGVIPRPKFERPHKSLSRARLHTRK